MGGRHCQRRTRLQRPPQPANWVIRKLISLDRIVEEAGKGLILIDDMQQLPKGLAHTQRIALPISRPLQILAEAWLVRAAAIDGGDDHWRIADCSDGSRARPLVAREELLERCPAALGRHGIVEAVGRRCSEGGQRFRREASGWSMKVPIASAQPTIQAESGISGGACSFGSSGFSSFGRGG